YIYYFCFFQAEDVIRDRNVTGVQTCALPISAASHSSRSCASHTGRHFRARVKARNYPAHHVASWYIASDTVRAFSRRARPSLCPCLPDLGESTNTPCRTTSRRATRLGQSTLCVCPSHGGTGQSPETRSVLQRVWASACRYEVSRQWFTTDTGRVC